MEKAYILLSCEIGRETDLAEQLSQINEVDNVLVTYGAYDVVIEVSAPDAKSMDSLITGKIRKLEKIRSTITLRVMI